MVLSCQRRSWDHTLLFQSQCCLQKCSRARRRVGGWDRVEVTALEAFFSPSNIGQNKFDGWVPGSLWKVINNKVKPQNSLLDYNFFYLWIANLLSETNRHRVTPSHIASAFVFIFVFVSFKEHIDKSVFISQQFLLFSVVAFFDFISSFVIKRQHKLT